jgi:hypothetical protein
MTVPENPRGARVEVKEVDGPSADNSLRPVRSWSYEVFEALCILTGAVICVELGYRAAVVLGSRMNEPWVVLGVLVIVLLGMVAADVATGFTHFLADTVGDANTPILGPTLIQTFREHHATPMAMVEHHFVETNGGAAVTLLPVLLGIRLLTPVTSSAWASVFLAVFTACCMAVNQFHKWAHARTAPQFVRFLQRHRIVINPDDHARHHRAPHEIYYCILFGWLNATLDRLGFFTGITRVMRRLRIPLHQDASVENDYREEK